MQENALSYGIVIPVYKTSQYLEKCLQSILKQKYQHKRVVVVLDGADSAAKKIINQSNGIVKNRAHVKMIEIAHSGACHARNRGAWEVEKWGSDITIFWDSDCYMEPGALEQWANVLVKYPDVDFVYSDYRFKVSEMGSINGQEFDPWLLKCNNFISTMSPVRTKVKPRFDVSLKSLQDWDLWLTLIGNGHKGKYLPGIRFVTEVPTGDSISAKGCHPDVWLDRKDKVKKKHEIPDKPICFTSLACPERAVDVAKGFDNADFSPMPSFNRHKYKMIYLLGFYSQDALSHAKVFQNSSTDIKKVVHWMGGDIQALYEGVPVGAAMNLANVLQNNYVNLCESVNSKKMLDKLGIKSTIVKLPVIFDTTEKQERPKDFSVLCDVDAPYRKFFSTIIAAMPDVKFVELGNMADLSKHYVLVRLTATGVLDEVCKKFLLSGKRVISNIAEPYTGFVLSEGDIARFCKDLVSSIRNVQDIFQGNKADTITEKAKAYYLNLLSWDTYKGIVNSIFEKGMQWKKQEIISQR